jgi:hypothetical protein
VDRVSAGIGLGAAAGLTRLMKPLLFGVSPLDLLTYAAIPLVLVGCAVIASYLPARRAAAVDPAEALRAGEGRASFAFCFLYRGGFLAASYRRGRG